MTDEEAAAINSRFMKLEADVYVLRAFVTKLAVLNPLAHSELEALPELIENDLMHRSIPDVRIELARRSADLTLQALRNLRLGMAQQDVETFSLKPSET